MHDHPFYWHRTLMVLPRVSGYVQLVQNWVQMVKRNICTFRLRSSESLGIPPFMEMSEFTELLMIATFANPIDLMILQRFLLIPYYMLVQVTI